MRFLRMLTNAAVAGLVTAAYLTALVLLLNPQLPLASVSAGHWALAMVGFYGVVTAVGVWLLLFLREMASSVPTSPAWLSVRVLAWTGAIAAGGVAWATWANLAGLAVVLDDAATERLRNGALAFTVAAVVLALIAAARLSFGRRGGRPAGVVLTPVLLASIVVPLALRGAGDIAPPSVPPVYGSPPTPMPLPAGAPLAGAAADGASRAVRMILLDGASLGFVRERVAAGQLPNFGRILDRGAIVPMATLRPTQPEPVWAAAATGKYPARNGIRSTDLYRAQPRDPDVVNLLPDFVFAQGLIDLGFITTAPAGADALRARTLWEILSAYHHAAGVVRWPLTWPAKAARGFIISDRFEDASRSPLRLDDTSYGAPTTAAELARGAFDATQFAPWPEVLPADLSVRGAADLLANARWDRSYAEALRRLDAQFSVDLTAVRYTGIDWLSHAFFRYTEPAQLFGPAPNLTVEDRRRYGGAVDAIYNWIDAQVGAMLAGLRPGDLLLVVSGFGMDAVSLPNLVADRMLGREQSGTHDRAPDGFLMAFGTNVAHGEFPRGAIVDLTPTVLYYLGIPVGRDMDGYPRTDIFQRSFTLGVPTTFIATHDR